MSQLGSADCMKRAASNRLFVLLAEIRQTINIRSEFSSEWRRSAGARAGNRVSPARGGHQAGIVPSGIEGVDGVLPQVLVGHVVGAVSEDVDGMEFNPHDSREDGGIHFAFGARI